jgi:hypothetical protein
MALPQDRKTDSPRAPLLKVGQPGELTGLARTLFAAFRASRERSVIKMNAMRKSK